jgi:hypothetical protein
MKTARPTTLIVILSGAIELPEDMWNIDLLLSKFERSRIAELLPPKRQKAA